MRFALLTALLVIAASAAAQSTAQVRQVCNKGVCKDIMVADHPVYGGLYTFRESPGGRQIVVYSGPLGTIPQAQLQAANGSQPETPHFQLVSGSTTVTTSPRPSQVQPDSSAKKY